jgi:hypothetical protein
MFGRKALHSAYEFHGDYACPPRICASRIPDR